MKEIFQNDSLGLNRRKQRCKITEAFLVANLQDCTYKTESFVNWQNSLFISFLLFNYLSIT